MLNKQHHTNGLLIDNLSYFTCEICDEVAPALGLYPGYGYGRLTICLFWCIASWQTKIFSIKSMT